MLMMLVNYCSDFQVVTDIPSPFAPYTAGPTDTSHDEEIARRFHIELNREALGILGDGGLVILSCDSEEEVIEEEEVDEEESEEEVKDKPVGSGSSIGGEAAPISPPSP
jgi:hypothetical protein